MIFSGFRVFFVVSTRSAFLLMVADYLLEIVFLLNWIFVRLGFFFSSYRICGLEEGRWVDLNRGNLIDFVFLGLVDSFECMNWLFCGLFDEI